MADENAFCTGSASAYTGACLGNDVFLCDGVKGDTVILHNTKPICMHMDVNKNLMGQLPMTGGFSLSEHDDFFAFDKTWDILDGSRLTWKPTGYSMGDQQ